MKALILGIIFILLFREQLEFWLLLLLSIQRAVAAPYKGSRR